MSSSSYLLKPSNAGIYQINALNVNNLWINGMSINDFITAAQIEHNLTDAEILELRAIVNRIDITNLTGNWVVDDSNRNAVLKALIDALNTKTQYITSAEGENAAAFPPGLPAVSPTYVKVQPSQSNKDWKAIELTADASNSYIGVYKDASTSTTAGRNQIILKNTNNIELNSSLVKLKGGVVSLGSGSDNVEFPTLTVSQPINVADIVFGFATGSSPAFIVGKIIASTLLPNYSDLFGMKTATISRDAYVRTHNNPVIKDYTLYNLDAVNVLPVESTYIANGNISKSCLVGDQNYYTGSGNIELRVDDFTNIGSLTLNDKSSKTNKVKVSNQSVEIRSNNGTSGNVVIHNGCPSGVIQFTKGTMNSDSASVSVAMELLNPDNATSMLTTQVVMGANTRQQPTQLFSYDPKSKLIVDTTQFSFSGTGKTGTHGILVVDTDLLTTTTNTTYVDAGNVSSKSFTLQNNYSSVNTTNTIYLDSNANLMYNGQQVAVGSVAASGGGLTYVITCPTTTTITTPSYTYPTDLTMSGTYVSTVNRTITLSSYANNTAYQLCTIKGLIPTASNPVLDGTYELNQHVNYTGSISASLYAKLYFYADTPATALLINKSYTTPAGSGTVATIYTPYVPVANNDMTLVITSVTFPQVLANSGSANSPLVCTIVNQSGTVLYTFPTLTATNNTTADRTFTPTSSPQTITVTSGITSFRFVLTNTAATTPTMSQASALNVNNANYTVANGSSVKMLLYDGSNNKTVLATATQSIYALSLPLPANPFTITDWITPYLQLDEFFIQPTGSTTGHTCVLQFNDGNLSHLHTSIASVSATPTLSSVMSAGNSVGSNALNMNSQNINNAGTITASTITPTTITGWNVKDIVAGANITITPTAGSYTIASSASGTTSGLGSADDVFASTILPRKQTTYGYLYNWTDTLTSMPYMGDIWVNKLGTLAMVASGVQGGTQPLRRSAAPTNDNSYPLGMMWNTVSPAKYWWSICGSDTGDRIYALSRLDGATANQVWLSTDFGITFSLFSTQPPSPFSSSATQGKIRCSGDGKYILIHDWVGNGRIYRSADYGSTWTTTQVTGSSMQIAGIAVSATGQYQYLALYGGGVRRSIDYGASWIQGNPNALNFERLACSATGKVVIATIAGAGLKRSMDYGQTWFDSITVATDVACSATGNLVWVGTSTGTKYSIDFGNAFYEPYTPAAINNIVMSSDGQTVMASRSSGYVHLLVENPNRIIQLTVGNGIKAVETAPGIYQISLSTATNPPPPTGYNTTQTALSDGITPTVGGGNTPEQDRVTAATCVIPRKAYWYGTAGNWNPITVQPSGGDHKDCYISATGKYILGASGTDGMPLNQYPLQLNTNYGESAWSNTGGTKYWKSVCGSATGDRMYGISLKWALGDTTNTFWTSSDYGSTWSQITNMPTIPQAFSSDSSLHRVRCCGLGRNIYIGSGTAGLLYRSNDFGANWTETQIVAGTVGGIAVSSTGQYVYVAIPSVGLYRSYDYGSTFAIINNTATSWSNMCCSATGQFVIATRGNSATYAYSIDYGASWNFGANNYADATMSGCGNLVWFCNSTGVAWSDNNGKTIQTSYTTSNPHSCIVMSNDGNYVYSGLSYASGNGGRQAWQIREPLTQIRNLNSGTGISITGDSTSGSYTITNTLSAPASNTLYNQKITNITSVGSGLVNNGWYVTLDWDFTNYEYDIQFDLQIGSGGYYPANIFWFWHDITNTNQYHHSWHDHDGATFHGAGQDYDNRITYIQSLSNYHHNCNMVLKQVRCPNTSYYQRLNLIANVSSLTLAANTSSMASSKIAFSQTHNYCMSASTSDTYFNGTRTIYFYCNLNNSALVGSGNDAWLKIRRIPIT